MVRCLFLSPSSQHSLRHVTVSRGVRRGNAKSEVSPENCHNFLLPDTEAEERHREEIIMGEEKEEEKKKERKVKDFYTRNNLQYRKQRRKNNNSWKYSWKERNVRGRGERHVSL